MRTVVTNEALERTLTRERLAKYLVATGQNLDSALKLYEENTRLSEAFYTPLQSVEVCLRNCLHEQLTAAYGDEWYRSQDIPFNNDTRRMIFDVIEELRKDRRPVISGQIVAELKFAFWVGLMGPRYDATLWRRALYKAFLADGWKTEINCTWSLQRNSALQKSSCTPRTNLRPPPAPDPRRDNRGHPLDVSRNCRLGCLS